MSDSDSPTPHERFASLSPMAQSVLLATIVSVPPWACSGGKIKKTAGAVVVFVRLCCLHWRIRAKMPARKAIYWSLAFAKALCFTDAGPCGDAP